MDLSDPQDRRRWLDHLSGLVAGRKVVCGVAPLAALTEFVEMFARAGAEKPLGIQVVPPRRLVLLGTTPLLLYTSRGAGPVPGEEDAQLLQVETPRYATLSEEVRDQERVPRSASADVREALDGYDPRREALRVVGPFASTDPVDGRAVVGGRERSWAALEDKIVAPMPSGTFAKIDADGLLGAGERVGPLNAALLRLLDERLGAGIGPVETAPDVRRDPRSAVRRSDHHQRQHDDGDVHDDLADADLLGTEPAAR